MPFRRSLGSREVSHCWAIAKRGGYGGEMTAVTLEAGEQIVEFHGEYNDVVKFILSRKRMAEGKLSMDLSASWARQPLHFLAKYLDFTAMQEI